MSQSELADKIGVSAMTISNWERIKTSPGDDEEVRLRAVLGDALESPELLTTSSPLATWLTKARLSAKMSVPELALKSGITPPAIYRIEQGVTRNLRKRTREQLEKALGAAMPKDALAEVEVEAAVEGLGQLEDFDPHIDEERPDEPGIYVLYDISERPIYVGEGAKVRARIRDHEEKFWFKRPIVESASWIKIADDTLRRQVETLLIKFLKSNAVINKQNVVRE
jgi:transcriptional regulator with XRE-family HTH domain